MLLFGYGDVLTAAQFTYGDVLTALCFTYGSEHHSRQCIYGSALQLRQLVRVHSFSESYHFGEPSRAEPDPPVPYARSGRCLGLASACCNCTSPGIQKLTAISRAVTHRCPKLAHFHQGPFMTPQLRNG